MDVDKLYGKYISVNGDSICNGAGCDGGYVKIIADRCGMKYQNVAVNGASIVAESYRKSGEARHWISRTVSKMDPDADYAIVEGGVNDASISEIKLGKMSEGYDGPLDDTTFIGAFESMLKQLTKKYSGKKIGYIAVHQMTKRFSATYGGDDSFYLAAKRCCEKWGVPFCDLNVSCPPFGFFAEDGDPDLYAMRVAYTMNGDGWHPNETGYLKYYCDKIESWLKSL